MLTTETHKVIIYFRKLFAYETSITVQLAFVQLKVKFDCRDGAVKISIKTIKGAARWQVENMHLSFLLFSNSDFAFT